MDPTDEYEEEEDFYIDDEEEWDGEDYGDTAYLVVEPESVLVAVERDSMYRGCLVVDTGCSCSVSSLRAADLLQLDRIEEEGSEERMCRLSFFIWVPTHFRCVPNLF